MVIFMKKIDSTVVHETKFIALAVIFFSAVTELVFLIIGKWDYTVLLWKSAEWVRGSFEFSAYGNYCAKRTLKR